MKIGVQKLCNQLKKLDSGFRRNDKKWCFRLPTKSFLLIHYCYRVTTGNYVIFKYYLLLIKFVAHRLPFAA